MAKTPLDYRTESFVRRARPLAHYIFVTERLKLIQEAAEAPSEETPESEEGSESSVIEQPKQHVPKLSPEQREQLVLNNLKLAYSIANRYYNVAADDDDVNAHALAALERATRFYNPEKINHGRGDNNHFGAFAARIIRNELNRLYRKEKNYKDHEFTDLDAPMYGDDGGDSDASDETGKDFVPDPNPSIADMIGSDDLSNPEIRDALNATFAEMFQTLKPRDKKALELFANGLTLREIGADPEVNASRTHVSNVISRFIGTARKVFRERGLGDLIKDKDEQKTNKYGMVRVGSKFVKDKDKLKREAGKLKRKAPTTPAQSPEELEAEKAADEAGVPDPEDEDPSWEGVSA